MIRFQSRFKICWLRKDEKKKKTNKREIRKLLAKNR